MAGYLPIIISALLYHFRIRLSRRFSFFIPLYRKKMMQFAIFFFQNTLFMDFMSVRSAVPLMTVTAV